jgi:hypothetical protein
MDAKMSFPRRPSKRDWRDDDPPQCPFQPPPQPQNPAYSYSPLATVIVSTYAHRASSTTLTCTTGWSSSKLPASSSQSPPGSFRSHFLELRLIGGRRTYFNPSSYPSATGSYVSRICGASNPSGSRIFSAVSEGGRNGLWLENGCQSLGWLDQPSRAER